MSLASGSRYQSPQSEDVLLLGPNTGTEYSAPPGTEYDLNQGTSLEQPAPQDPLGTEGQESTPVRVSSSPDEAVTGSSLTAVTEDSRTHQEHLRRVVQNLGLQVEEISDNINPMVDILARAGPSRVALPLIKIIQDRTKSLWQSPASLPPIAKRVERKYVPSKDHQYLYSHPHQGHLFSWWPTSMKGKISKVPWIG